MFSPQTDVGALYSQLKELQKKNADMEERNKMLYSKVYSFPCSKTDLFCIKCIDDFFLFVVHGLQLQTKEAENESLETRLNVLVSYNFKLFFCLSSLSIPSFSLCCNGVDMCSCTGT